MFMKMRQMILEKLGIPLSTIYHKIERMENDEALNGDLEVDDLLSFAITKHLIAKIALKTRFLFWPRHQKEEKD